MKKILICEINNIVFLCILILFKSRKNSNEGKNYYNYYHILFALRIQYVFMLVRNHLTLKQSSLLIKKKKKEKKNEVVHLLCFKILFIIFNHNFLYNFFYLGLLNILYTCTFNCICPFVCEWNF